MYLELCYGFRNKNKCSHQYADLSFVIRLFGPKPTRTIFAVLLISVHVHIYYLLSMQNTTITSSIHPHLFVLLQWDNN